MPETPDPSIHGDEEENPDEYHDPIEGVEDRDDHHANSNLPDQQQPVNPLPQSSDQMYRDYLASVNQRVEQLSQENDKKMLSAEELWRLAQEDVLTIVKGRPDLSSSALLKAFSRQQDIIADLSGRMNSLHSKYDKLQQFSGLNVNPKPRDFQNPLNNTTSTSVMHVNNLDFSTPKVPMNSTGIQRTFNFSLEEDKSFKRKLMDAEPFKGDGTQSWESYFNQFLVVSDHNKWTKAEACFQLKRAMKGKAAEFLFDDPSGSNVHHSFEGLVSVLQGRFGSLDNPSQDSKELRTRKKRKGETWKDMAQDILQRCRRLYTSDENAMQREAIQAFLRAVPDKYRVAAAACGSKRLDDLVQTVINLCATDDVDEMNCSTVTVTGRVNMVTPTSSDNNKSNGQRSLIDQTQLICFGCHEKGHYRRYCPNKQVKCPKCKGWGHHGPLCPNTPTGQQGNDARSQ
jgi:hypothetical protein